MISIFKIRFVLLTWLKHEKIAEILYMRLQKDPESINLIEFGKK